MLTPISPWGIVLVFTFRAITFVLAERSEEEWSPSFVGVPRAVDAHRRLSPTRGGGRPCRLEVAGVRRVVRVAGKFHRAVHNRDATWWHQTTPRPSCANRHHRTNEVEERRTTPEEVGGSPQHSYPAVVEVVVVVVVVVLDGPNDVVGAMAVELEEPSVVVVVDGVVDVTGNNWLDTHCP